MTKHTHEARYTVVAHRIGGPVETYRGVDEKDAATAYKAEAHAVYVHQQGLWDENDRPIECRTIASCHK